MDKNLRVVFIGIVLIFLAACGSKKSPTGGEIDTEKPKVLSSFPLEMGDVSQGKIEIDFSKQMDRNTIQNSVYIYPPIERKKVTLNKSTLSIQIFDDLLNDSFYYVTLTTRLKDLRGNPLAKAQTLVFRNGNPDSAMLSGLLKYEESSDSGLPIQLSLFSSDSLLVRVCEISGSSFQIEHLKPSTNLLRAFIDKNQNGRYDDTVEPFFEKSIEVKTKTNLDLELCYNDTTWAQIKSVKVSSPHELDITLSKPIQTYTNISIVSSNGKHAPDILYKTLDMDKLTILTTALDSLRYTITMSNLGDYKGNTSPQSSYQFTYMGTPDKTSPKIMSSLPRNGATVNSLKPVLEIQFSEIITKERFKAKLIESDNKLDVPYEVIEIIGRTVRIRPLKDLSNYRSHTIRVLKDTSDYSGNLLGADSEIVFLPIKRN